MRSFLARCTMIGLLVCGFALTGDAGWIVSRGQSLLNATTVPAVADLWGSGSNAAAQPAPATPGPAPAAPPAPSEPAWAAGFQPAPVEVHVSPSLAAPAVLPPADGGQAVVDLRLLRPGDRVQAWVAGSPVVFDLVDPASGEAIQQPATRRVQLAGAAQPHRIERNGWLLVRPRAGVSGHEPPPVRIGPVQAIQVQ